jgi:hypothetical protein
MEDAMRSVAILFTLLFATLIMVGQTSPTDDKAQAKTDKKAASAKETKWQGHIVRIDKDKNMMSVRGGRGGKQQFEREVSFDSSTKWTKQNKPADQSDFKEGSFVIVVGKPDAKGTLHADRVDLRLPR